MTRAIGQLGWAAVESDPCETIESCQRLPPRSIDFAEAGDGGGGIGGRRQPGSFDDGSRRALCEERGIWLHVDGAHGASALLSSKPPRALNGLRYSRSLAWDPHKMMLLPLAAGMVLTRDEGDLERAFAQQAPYLFHAGKSTRIIDQGIRSFNVPCRADVEAVVVMQRWNERIGAAMITFAIQRGFCTMRSKREAISRICTCRSRTSFAFDISGPRAEKRREAPWSRVMSSRSMRSIVSSDRATTGKAPAGSRRPCWAAGRCCG